MVKGFRSRVYPELGGRYEDSYVATLLGNQIKVYPNDLVLAALRFSTHEHNGVHYQDITIQEIIPFTSH